MGAARTVFVINSLLYGGAERVLSLLLAYARTSDPDRELHLVLLDREPERREMPAGVIKHQLDARGSLRRSIWPLRETIRSVRPDVVVSFLVRANVASALAARSLGVPVVVCERMHLSSHLSLRHKGLARMAAGWAPPIAYRLADRVLGVSTGVTNDLIKNFAAPKARTLTLYNPYPLSELAAMAAEAPEIFLPRDFAVAAGRLVDAKDFPLLIDAFLASQARGSLVILGEGPERSQLEDIIAAQGARGRVLMPGYVRNPFAVLGRANAFISASRNEGFPNAMVEAMALGIPIVATDCPSGPAEILRGELAGRKTWMEAPHGILVRPGSLAGLTEGINALQDTATHRRLSLAARERAADFDLGVIARQYWDVFRTAAKHRS